MNSFEQTAIKEIIRSELGSGAKFYECNTEYRTPMTFVLDEVRSHIGDIFSIYWVKSGHPEIFCLNGFSKTPVIFNTRYLSLSILIRQLFNEIFENGLIIENAERTSLKIMAELAIRKGDPDIAVLAFVKSMIGKNIFSFWGENEEVDINELELTPIDESYMAIWFYGLVHELGHLTKNENNVFSSDQVFSDVWIQNAIEKCLSVFPCSDEIKKEAMDRAKNKSGNSILGIDQLRSEAFADIFACNVMFRTTYKIMKEIGQHEFSVIRFIQETIIFHNVIGIMDFCRKTATTASATDNDRETQIENLLHPVSLAVRSLILRQHLDLVITKFFYGDQPTAEQYENIRKDVYKIGKSYENVIDTIESGIARAMRFLLSHKERENDWILLEKFQEDLLKSQGIGSIETKGFCKMADSLGKKSKLLTALKGILNDPTKKIEYDIVGDLVYIIPWIKGLNNFSKPFGIDTKYGHLIFAFVMQDELYESFFTSSAESLKEGYILQSAIVAVPKKEQLGRELVPFVSGVFRVIVEGTEEFNQYVKELSNDSIWE